MSTITIAHPLPGGIERSQDIDFDAYTGPVDKLLAAGGQIGYANLKNLKVAWKAAIESRSQRIYRAPGV